MSEIFKFQIVYLNNTLLYVHIKQTGKYRWPEPVIHRCSLKWMFLEKKKKKVGKIVVKQLCNCEGFLFLVNVWAVDLQIYGKWTLSQIFYENFAKTTIYPSFIMFLKI